ncbi:hypothetical protein Tco_0624955 [Tanacetum coccineum]|uniref:Uncharacterized protein n=1 Tax=Tanacetum coccineum TaxID=301880 RepID=A0ABQ4WFH2_9ASTR
MVGLLFNKYKGDRVRVLLRPRNFAWFKKKMLLVQEHESGQVLDEEKLAFLADPGVVDAKVVLMANLLSYDSDVFSKVPHSNTYQNDMINQSVQEMHYSEKTSIDDYPNNEIKSDSNIIPYSQYMHENQNAVVQDTNSSTQQDSLIISMFEQMSEQMSDHVTNWDKVNEETETVNESLTAELERYKE